MPYRTVSGAYERASRLGHGQAVVRAMADRRSFFVPAEQVPDRAEIRDRVSTKESLGVVAPHDRLTGAIGVDGSLMVVPVRDGVPSVRYGYAQAAAIWLDLDAVESQREERFVDPSALARAVNSALISLDFPVAGAYLREGMATRDSWRESVFEVFTTKAVQANRADQSLLDLLFLLHGRPGAPATVLPVRCPNSPCPGTVSLTRAAEACPACGHIVYPTDVLRIHEEVVEDGTNEAALSRLMQVVELLVLVGLASLLWEQARDTLLAQTLFILDGPLAVYGPPAKLRGRALEYFQSMMNTTWSSKVHLCGIEKSGSFVDYGENLARNDVLAPGELLTVDQSVLSLITNGDNPIAYGSETYWGRKFLYRALDGRVVVLTVPPERGAPYDDQGGQPSPGSYASLGRILDVIDRTGSSMYRNGVIPVALAHGKAAYPIGVGTDVLRLVAKEKLGLSGAPRK